MTVKFELSLPCPKELSDVDSFETTRPKKSLQISDEGDGFSFTIFGINLCK